MTGKGITRLQQLNKTGVPGDCLRTCIACLLGLDNPGSVPNFMRSPVDAWYSWMRDWLYVHAGLSVLRIPLEHQPDPDTEMMGMGPVRWPVGVIPPTSGYGIASGIPRTQRLALQREGTGLCGGTRASPVLLHSVVVRFGDGQMVVEHDPHPELGGVDQWCDVLLLMHTRPFEVVQGQDHPRVPVPTAQEVLARMKAGEQLRWVPSLDLPRRGGDFAAGQVPVAGSGGGLDHSRRPGRGAGCRRGRA